MAGLKLYNSLARQKQVFEPLDPDHVTLYACGPTVYSYAHIGNARAAVVFDMLRSVLEALYPKVTHVANITDIEDKIIKAAQDLGEPISAITRKFTDIYNADMAALGVQKPHIQPHATDHVDGMIAMCEALIAKGHAYEKDGHVLFHVPSFPAYGRLSGRNRDEQIAGARVEVAPYKKDPADFVLWKPSTGDQPGWNSPFGFGRPGWHIECSVMAREFLGDVFDIHGGGLDLTFPHHENEIAQSCCATGKDQFARYWVHNGFVTVEGEKMSKSIGNVLLVHDMIAQGIPGEAIRLSLLSTHYRQPFDWTDEGLKHSVKTLNKWYEVLNDQKAQSGSVHPDVMAAMADDLNTPPAIAALHKIAKENPKDLYASGRLLGLFQSSPAEWFAAQKPKQAALSDSEIQSLIDQRNQARKDKNFALADQIRDDLAAKGIILKDGSDGTRWETS